jgi:hypothetical protein
MRSLGRSISTGFAGFQMPARTKATGTVMSSKMIQTTNTIRDSSMERPERCRLVNKNIYHGINQRHPDVKSTRNSAVLSQKICPERFEA